MEVRWSALAKFTLRRGGAWGDVPPWDPVMLWGQQSPLAGADPTREAQPFASERSYLFGSKARGDEGPTSDYRIWVPWRAASDQPRGWRPDLDDDVRVNIAPLQRAGLLAAPVLSPKDLNSLRAPEGR